MIILLRRLLQTGHILGETRRHDVMYAPGHNRVSSETTGNVPFELVPPTNITVKFTFVPRTADTDVIEMEFYNMGWWFRRESDATPIVFFTPQSSW